MCRDEEEEGIVQSGEANTNGGEGFSKFLLEASAGRHDRDATVWWGGQVKMQERCSVRAFACLPAHRHYYYYVPYCMHYVHAYMPTLGYLRYCR